MMKGSANLLPTPHPNAVHDASIDSLHPLVTDDKDELQSSVRWKRSLHSIRRIRDAVEVFGGIPGQVSAEDMLDLRKDPQITRDFTFDQNPADVPGHDTSDSPANVQHPQSKRLAGQMHFVSFNER
jgi:hypothetical protein